MEPQRIRLVSLSLVFASFITPFSKSFLISLSKISISVLFLGCSKFELLIGCWLKLTSKPCCTILSVYLSSVIFFQFSKRNLILSALNFSARSYSFLISLTFTSCCIGPCSSSHRSCFVLMGSSSCFLSCMELMSYCCKGCMMASYFFNSELYLLLEVLISLYIFLTEAILLETSSPKSVLGSFKILNLICLISLPSWGKTSSLLISLI